MEGGSRGGRVSKGWRHRVWESLVWGNLGPALGAQPDVSRGKGRVTGCWWGLGDFREKVRKLSVLSNWASRLMSGWFGGGVQALERQRVGGGCPVVCPSPGQLCFIFTSLNSGRPVWTEEGSQLLREGGSWEGGSSGEGKLFLCGGEWLVQGWPLRHLGDPRFCLFLSPACPGVAGSPPRYHGRTLVF